MNIEALKPHLDEELYSRIADKLGAVDGISVISTKDGSWVPKSRLDEVLKDSRDMKTQLIDLQKRLDASQTSASDNTTTINALNARVAELLKDVETRDNQISGMKRASRVSETVRKTNARDVDLVLRLLDLDKITEDEQGNLAGLSEQLDALKQTSDYLFFDTGSKGGFAGGREPALPSPNNNTAMNDAIRAAAGVK